MSADSTDGEGQTPRVPYVFQESMGCINPYQSVLMKRIPSLATCCAPVRPVGGFWGTLHKTVLFLRPLLFWLTFSFCSLFCFFRYSRYHLVLPNGMLFWLPLNAKTCCCLSYQPPFVCLIKHEAACHPQPPLLPYPVSFCSSLLVNSWPSAGRLHMTVVLLTVSSC